MKPSDSLAIMALRSCIEPTTCNCVRPGCAGSRSARSEEQTSELQSLMRVSYTVLCSKKTERFRLRCPNRVKPTSYTTVDNVTTTGWLICKQTLTRHEHYTRK